MHIILSWCIDLFFQYIFIKRDWLASIVLYLDMDTGEVVVQRRALDDSDSDTDGDDPRVELASSHSSDDDFDVPEAARSSSSRRWRKSNSKQPHSRKSFSSFQSMWTDVFRALGKSSLH
jgi:hypothetical protein